MRTISRENLIPAVLIEICTVGSVLEVQAYVFQKEKKKEKALIYILCK